MSLISHTTSIQPSDSASNVAEPIGPSGGVGDTASCVSSTIELPIKNSFGERFATTPLTTVHSVVGGSDYVTPFRGLLSVRGVPVDGAVPVKVAWITAPDAGGAAGAGRVDRIATNAYVADPEAVMGRTGAVMSAIRYLSAVDAHGPIPVPPLVNVAGWQALLAGQTAATVTGILAAGEGVLLNANWVALARHILDDFHYSERHRADSGDPLEPIVHWLGANVPALLTSIMADPNNVAYQSFRQVIIAPSIHGVDIRIHHRKLLPVFFDFVLRCQLPSLAVAVAALGRANVPNLSYINYVNRIRAAYVAGTDIQAAIGVAVNLPDEDRDIDGEGGIPVDRLLHVAPGGLADIANDNVTFRLYWDLSAQVDQTRLGRRAQRATVGGLMPLTIRRVVEDTNCFTVRYSTQSFETNTDITRLGASYQFLGGNLTSISWRQNSQTANARFQLGREESAVAKRLGYVSPSTATMDCVGAWVKPWLWHDLRVQMQGITSVRPEYDLNLMPPGVRRQFPKIWFVPDNWGSDPVRSDRLWAEMLLHQPEEILIYRESSGLWEDVAVLSMLMMSWPPSNLELVGGLGLNWLDLFPATTGVNVEPTFSHAFIIVISSSLFTDYGGDPAVGHIVLNGPDWAERISFAGMPPAAIKRAISRVARQLEYTSTAVYARHLSIQLANVRGRCVPSTHAWGFVVPSFLTTNDILLPQPRFKAPAAHFFSEVAVSQSAHVYGPLDTIISTAQWQEVRASLAYALAVQTACQTTYLSHEWHGWFQFFELGHRSERPSLQFLDGSGDLFYELCKEGDGFKEGDECVSDFIVEANKILRRATGFAMPSAVIARIRLFAASDHSRGRTYERCLRRGVFDDTNIFLWLFPDEPLSVVGSLPILWPSVLLSDSIDVGAYMRRDEQVIPAVNEWSTVVNGPNCAHAFVRLEKCIPAMRIVLTALERYVVTEYIYTESTVAQPPLTGRRDVQLERIRLARGAATNVPNIDVLRTWNPCDGTSVDFMIREGGMDVFSQHLVSSGSCYNTVFAGLPSCSLVTRATPVSVVSAYRRQRRAGAQMVEQDDVQSQLKRLKADNDVLAAEMSAVRRRNEALATQMDVYNRPLSVVVEQVQATTKQTSDANELLKRNEELQLRAEQMSVPASDAAAAASLLAPAAPALGVPGGLAGDTTGGRALAKSEAEKAELLRARGPSNAPGTSQGFQ